MAWFLLVIAGIEEIIAAIAMKYIDGTRKKMADHCDDAWIRLILLLPVPSDDRPACRSRLCRLDRHWQHWRFGGRAHLV